ncbi:MAG: hypothetical protein M1840_007620 [Geoglossum simile]|nr:MAG: hypothetical protein M1840_007620 [Geoglossum simile]
MLRLRRYRSFLIFTIFAIFALYRFRSTHLAANSPFRPSHPTGQGDVVVSAPREPTAETRPYVAAIPEAESTQEQALPPSIPPISKPTQAIAQPTQTPAEGPPLDEAPPANPTTITEDDGGLDQEQYAIPTSTSTVIHWSRLPEHFPVPSESVIQLPSGKPKAIPKIQHKFSDESSWSRTERGKKQAAIKRVFKKAWTGYKEHAWLHDELSPISGGNRDPFCGWAATLVDSLDTLWIMGFEDEFKEALEALKEIDFTTSGRADIPLFETTIRYLGGLLGAYDVSGAKYSILVEKAVELGDVLMGAFDTPNRMPITYYRWKPAFASQPHKASTRIVLAELGSLTVEFTRLAQITKDPKYFDAVQRITDELEKSQNTTRLPGMWPTFVDGSGCTTQESTLPSGGNTEQEVIADPPTNREETVREGQQLSENLADKVGAQDVNGLPKNQQDSPLVQEPLVKPPPIMLEPVVGQSGEPGTGDKQASPGKIEGHEPSRAPDASEHPSISKRQVDKAKDCVPQGLKSPPHVIVDTFTLGGMSDSLYEYFPKEYMLLGGQEQYRRLYEKSIEVAKQYIFFRPMTPNNHDILISGSISVNDEGPQNLRPDGEHLGCFTGGMLAIGAKIFEREEDLAVGAKLADGCVWAYESTASGIMPEGFSLIPCDTKDCMWNETKWVEALTPDYDYKPNPPLPKIKATPTTNTTVAREAAPSEQEPEPETPMPPPTREEIAAEIMYNNRLPLGFEGIHNRHYILRPEAIESVFILYRITGDPSWRAKGWKMFQAIENATSAEFGNSAISDVTVDRPHQINEMESFFLAETLKYFYLLFSEPDVISLDDYIL